jgi:sugar phosphate isomerase/epimerase
MRDIRFQGGCTSTIALSLAAFDSQEAAADYLSSAGADARFELAYTMSRDALDILEPGLRGKVVSVHACCPAAEHFPNFASENPEVVAESFRDMAETLGTAVRFGAAMVVLHPGYATDSAMPSSFAERKALLGRPEFLAEIRHAEGAICGPGYNRTERYRTHALRAMESLGELAERYAERGVRLAAENLNPRAGYLFHTPDEMAEIAGIHRNLGVCLDIGHLYMSSFAYGFDFLEGVREIVSTGKVLSCHLHGNSSGPARFRDDHASLDRFGFPFEAALGILVESGAALVLEVVEEPERNVRLVERLARERR